jgi:UDP-2,3-diacylglucosamine pyrophosphatase LpxH
MVSVYRFVADIHLRPGAEDETGRFTSWLSSSGQDEVYILGDLFDYWYTGMETRFSVLIQALKSPRVHVLPGNRDFLLRNARIQGIDIVKEEELVMTTGNKKILLAHGHTLTSADAGFKFLHRYGWPVIERFDRMLPTAIKDRLARALVKSSAIVRPSAAEIRPDIARIKNVDMVICGHLHRQVERDGLFVLPAYFDAGAWLAWDAKEPVLEPCR